MKQAEHEDMARFGGHARYHEDVVSRADYWHICAEPGRIYGEFRPPVGFFGAPMPETEETVTETDSEPSDPREDNFPELRTARRLGNLMEKAEPGMRQFLLAWLTTRYGPVS